MEDALRAVSGLVGGQLVMGWLYAHLGRVDEVRRELEDFTRRDLDAIRPDFFWLSAMCALADMCAVVGDRERAREVYERLLPFAHRQVFVGYTVYLGCAAHALGRLAATMQQWDEAARHYEEALASYGRLGALPYEALTAHALSQVLRMGRPDEHERCTRLHDRARELAHALGMAPLLARLADDENASPRLDAAPSTLTRPVTRLLFQRHGEYWTLGEEHRAFRIRHRVGLTHIARLLATPDQEVFAGSLAVGPAGANGAAEPIAAHLRPGETSDAGEAFDATAHAAYERRLRSLREQFEDADAANDLGRKEALRREIDAIAAELARGLGLGGRRRRAGSQAERARVTVTRAIKQALKVVDEHDQAFGTFLRRSVKTGHFCSFRSDRGRPVEWVL